MSKFKVGDRVRLLSDATQNCENNGDPRPNFGRKGEIGTVSHVSTAGDFIYVDGVGQNGAGFFSPQQLTHADPQPPVAHHDRVVTDTHAAIDRLVAHLERQATEHVHALDALRAEVESLRTQNAHLRALQAAQEAKPVREIDRNPDKVARTTIAGLPALSEDKDGPRRRHAVKHARGYVLYDEDDRIVACEATDDVALGWCQFGWPYGAKQSEPKPVREVVRGAYCSQDAMWEPRLPPWSGRHAIRYAENPTEWLCYSHVGPARACLTEPEAIAWVLDGVLPKR